MNYKVENNQVIFTDGPSRRNAKRGRKLGSRLGIIKTETKISLTDIARIYIANRLPYHLKSETLNDRVIQVCLSQVLANKDNSPAYIQAIESAWRLPIATIREYYQLDKTSFLQAREQVAFKNDYLQKCFPDKQIEKTLFGAAA